MVVVVFRVENRQQVDVLPLPGQKRIIKLEYARRGPYICSPILQKAGLERPTVVSGGSIVYLQRSMDNLKAVHSLR